MKNFEDKLKERFQDYASFRKIDSDELWNQISGNIEIKSKSSNNYLTLILLVFFIFMFAALGLYKVQNNSTKIAKLESELPNKTISDELTKDTEMETKKTSFSEASSLSIVQTQTNYKLLKETPTDIKPVVSLNRENDKKLPNEGKYFSMSSQENSIAETELSVFDLKTKKFGLDTELSNTHSQNLIYTSSKELSTKEFSKDIYIQQLPLKEITNLPSKYSEELLSLNFNSSEEIEPLIHKNKKLSIGLFFGINNLKYHLNGDSQIEIDRADTMQKTLSEQVGNNAAIEIRWKLNESFSIKSGVNFSTSKIVFDYVRQWDTLMVYNSTPGAPLIPTDVVRTIKHHNSFNQIGIPLLVSGERQFSRVSFGADLGIGLNYILNQKGRYLDSALKVRDAENSNSKLPHSNFYIDNQIHPYVSFMLSDRIRLNFKGNLNYSFTKYSELFGLNYNLSTRSFSIGLIYGY